MMERVRFPLPPKMPAFAAATSEASHEPPPEIALWRGGNFVASAPDHERQGDYICTDLTVWDCGDEHCDCRQVVVERRYWHKLVPLIYWRVRIWEGAFVSDYSNDPESRAVVAADLERALREVRQYYPDEKWGDVTVPNNQRAPIHPPPIQRGDND